MLVAAEGSEAKFIIRFLQGKMRVGVQMATIYQVNIGVHVFVNKVKHFVYIKVDNSVNVLTW
jgi:hypothetical protein